MTGKESDLEGGHGIEFLDRALITIMNYICKDPQAFQSGHDSQDVRLPANTTYIQHTFSFIDRLLQLNVHDQYKIAGVCALKIMTIMLENFECDNYLP